MSEQMTVVFVKSTGHVLSVVTRVAAKDDLKIDDVANPTLLVRNIGDPADPLFPTAQFLVPSAGLDVLTADLNPEVLNSPRSYLVDKDNKRIQPLPSSQAITLTPTPGAQQVTVAVASAVAVDTNVLVAVATPNSATSTVATGTISATTGDKKSVTLPVGPLPSGSHLLGLAAGFPPKLA